MVAVEAVRNEIITPESAIFQTLSHWLEVNSTLHPLYIAQTTDFVTRIYPEITSLRSHDKGNGTLALAAIQDKSGTDIQYLDYIPLGNGAVFSGQLLEQKREIDARIGDSAHRFGLPIDTNVGHSSLFVTAWGNEHVTGRELIAGYCQDNKLDLIGIFPKASRPYELPRRPVKTAA